MLQLTIDDREPKSYRVLVNNALSDMADTNVARLPVGDYSLDNGVLVERKTVSDLLASVADGRWAEQLPPLTEARLGILLLEGEVVATGRGIVRVGGKDTRWTENALDNLLLTAQSAGLLVARCAYGPAEVADRLRYIIRYLEKGDHDSLRPRRRIQVDERREELAVLLALPGCGPQTAKKLLGYYGSVQEVVRGILTGDDAIPAVYRERWKRIVEGT